MHIEEVRAAIIIQARMGSARIPGKVLLSVRGKPLLQYLLDRLISANLGMPIVIATSRENADQRIFDFCSERGVDCYRGSHLDVASRFIDIIDAYGLDGFVRLSGDSPLLDANIVKQAIEKMDETMDLVTNIYPRSYPRGQSVEILRAACFRANLPLMVDESDREHVTSFFYRNAEKFKIYNLLNKPSLANISMAVDTPKDFDRFRRLIETTGDDWVNLSFRQLLDRFQEVVSEEGLTL